MKVSLSPPTIMANNPFSAPGTPPLTGASSTRAFFAENILCSFRISWGELVLKSTHTVLLLAPSNNPSSPIATASTSVGPGRQVNTMSHFSDSSLGDSAQEAPISRAVKADSLFISWTVTLYEFRIMLRHILDPMLPRPINPMFIFFIKFTYL